MSTQVRNLVRSAMESNQQPDDYINPHLDVDVAPQKSEEYINATVSDQDQETEAYEQCEASVESHLAALGRIEKAYLGLEAHPFENVDSVSRGVIAFGLEDAAISTQVDLSDVAEKIKVEEGEKNKPQVGNKIVEAAKKILKRIVDFMVALFRRVQDFLLKLMGAGTQLKVRAKRVIDDLAKRDTTAQQSSGTIEAGDITKSLVVGETLPSGDASVIVKMLSQAATAANQVDERMVDAYDRDLNLVKLGLRSHDISKLQAALQSELQLGPAFRLYNGQDTTENKLDRTFNGLHYRTATMPGNKFVSVYYKPQIHDGVYYGVSYRVSLKDAKVDPKEASKDDIVSDQLKAMTADEITTAVSEMHKLLENLKVGQKVIARLRVISGHVTALQQMTATPTGATIVAQFNSRYKAVGQATTIMNTQLVRAGLAIMRWADASLQLYPTKVGA